MRDKKTKEAADGTRDSKKCRCDAYGNFCRAALEAKSARDCSQKLLFEGGMERQNSEPNEQWSDKGEQKWQTRLLWRPFGGQKSDFLMKSVRSRFAKSCLPLQREALVWKHVIRKVSWNMKIMKEGSCSLHFWCKFAPRSVGHNYFAFRSASAEPNENHKNRSPSRLECKGFVAMLILPSVFEGQITKYCKLQTKIPAGSVNGACNKAWPLSNTVRTPTDKSVWELVIMKA